MPFTLVRHGSWPPGLAAARGPWQSGHMANRALLVVDVQPTFCEGGALGVEGGNAVAEAVAAYAAEHRGDYSLVVTTQDWHIDPGDHFSDTPDFVDSWRSEEHTSELQSRFDLVCRLLLENK